MKLLVFLLVSATLFIGCKDNSILESEFEINLDKEVYEISDPIGVEFEVKANQTILFIEGKVIDENEITISSIANISAEGKEISGNFTLELTNQSLASGTYTVQLLIGTGTDTKRSYKSFELNGIERELVSLMVSESTLGTSMIHKINIDGSSTIWRSEPYTMDILTVNSRRQFIAYAYNEKKSVFLL